MPSFFIALSNVVLTLLYILPGFLVGKFKKASTEHLSSMSGVLIYVCSPCMVVNCFLPLAYKPEYLAKMGLMFAVSLVLQGAFIGLLYFLFHKKASEAKYRLVSVASTLGNVGFFGLPIINALLPGHPEALCYTVVNMISMNIIIFTIGVYCLTGKKEYMSVKPALLNPAVISFAVGLGIYLLGVGKYVPALLSDGIALLGKMTTPLCMIILGIRLASIPFKKLFSKPTVYLICACKLLIYPLFCFAVLYFIPLDPVFKTNMLILAATPCASVIFNLAEIHKSETELSANCVLLSTLLCFLTIPLITLLTQTY